MCKTSKALTYLSIIFFVISMISVLTTISYATSSESVAEPSQNYTLTTVSPIVEQSKIKIFASFYPIYDFIKKIGNEAIDVSTIVPSGIEPHDFEPTPKQVVELQNADLIFINGAGFEKWIEKIGNDHVVDLSKRLAVENVGDMPNPHVWLDPLMVKNMSQVILDVLISKDPQNAKYYKTNFEHFNTNLNKLDSDIAGNLTNCKHDDFIAFHNAFGYFSKRYGLNQHSIEGLIPEADINPQKVTDTIKLAKQLGINIIFSEENMDPRLSNTIANEINGQVLVLNPVEVITEDDQEKGKDYFSTMYENLNNLKIALDCKN